MDKKVEQFKKERAQAEAIAQTIEMSNQMKNLILDRMAGIYFRVEQLREKAPGYENITVAEVVNKMPQNTPEAKAVAFSWTVDYMLEAFYQVMREDGEEISDKIVGNLSQIEAPNQPQIVKV